MGMDLLPSASGYRVDYYSIWLTHIVTWRDAFLDSLATGGMHAAAGLTSASAAFQ